MKQLITILVALVSLTATGQVKQTYNQYGGKWKRLQIDSAIKIPMTIVGIKDVNAGVDTAQLRYDPADSTLKYHTGYQWLSAGGGTTTTVNPDGCIIGCTVTWIENYDYEVVESYYYIGNTLYHSPTATITLDPADGTDDRIDLFVLTTSNTADKVTGAPTTPPVEPTFDPSTQLKIAFAFVENGTTEPTVTQDWLYRENAGTPTEWAYTDNSANLNPASGSNPYGGSTVDIEGTTVAAGNSFTLTDLSTQNFSQYDGLVFKIRSKATWSRSISIRFFNGTTAVGNIVVFGNGLFGFVSSTTGAYQNINIPISSFGAIAGADRVTFTRMTGGGTIGFYLDDIQLLLTGSTVGTPQSLQNTSDATSHTVGLTGSASSFKIAEGANITITTTGSGENGVATIAATGAASKFGKSGEDVTAAENRIFDLTSGFALSIVDGADQLLHIDPAGDAYIFGRNDAGGANISINASTNTVNIVAASGAYISLDEVNKLYDVLLDGGFSFLTLDANAGTYSMGDISSFGNGNNTYWKVDDANFKASFKVGTGDRITSLGSARNLTESAATTFLRITVPSGEVAGGEIVATVEANDATDFQSRTLRFIWSAVNKAGTTTITISTPEEVVALSAGTLTATMTTIDSGSGNADFQIDAVSSLTQTTLRATAQVIKNFGSGVVTIQ